MRGLGEETVAVLGRLAAGAARPVGGPKQADAGVQGDLDGVVDVIEPSFRSAPIATAILRGPTGAGRLPAQTRRGARSRSPHRAGTAPPTPDRRDAPSARDRRRSYLTRWYSAAVAVRADHRAHVGERAISDDRFAEMMLLNLEDAERRRAGRGIHRPEFPEHDADAVSALLADLDQP